MQYMSVTVARTKKEISIRIACRSVREKNCVRHASKILIIMPYVIVITNLINSASWDGLSCVNVLVWAVSLIILQNIVMVTAVDVLYMEIIIGWEGRAGERDGCSFHLYTNGYIIIISIELHSLLWSATLRFDQFPVSRRTLHSSHIIYSSLGSSRSWIH